MSRKGALRSSRFAFLFFGALLLHPMARSGGRGLQADKTSATPTPTPVVIELFTSEGCSSCPPVDVLLKKLDAGQAIPGAQLIVLSEHVTYWDHDGWKDPNSSPALTDRQNSYEGELGEKSLYTPQLIVDGTQQVHAGNPKQIEETLQKAAGIPKIPVRIGDVTFDAGDPGHVQAHVETDTNSAKHNADVYMAVALDHVESQVLRGENGGRHLIHVAVVQELTKVGKLPKGKSFDHDVRLQLRPGTDPKNLRLVVLLQEPGPGRVLGAALRRPAS